MSMSSSSTFGKKTYKVILLGESGVGKTSIIQRFVNNRFEQKQNPTIGIDFLGKNVPYKNTTCRLQLWDTAGQQRFRSLIPNYLKDAICAIFVFDLSNEQSLANIELWINLFQNNRTQNSVLILCGNKSDKPKNCNHTLINTIMLKYSLKYFETSVVNSNGIDTVFKNIIEQIQQMQIKKKKKYEEVEIIGPLTAETLKSSVLESVNIKIQKSEENNKQLVKKRNLCC